ncbi:hypothetical protein F4821DRAFT_64820 [Hypoxylon rubiginosum]|uniref:Uncharacterized protein n=1 Tax=Hypoxylon rubiginosum TaxID=110542 RepID=A0ACC0D8S8_9PEZI|nr:hypothetical protein F4821DRAFT_64820 [Hypoxylon rubiginosum]
MELANPPYQEQLVVSGERCSTDVISSEAPRKLSLTNNFSYPRTEGRLSRHGSSDSRSSLTSNGSVPGMTDSSDSETSFEEDINYNTSASELWDSFWPNSTVASGEQYPVLLRASQTPNYFTKSFPKPEPQETDDTITLPKLQPVFKTIDYSAETPTPQPSPPRPVTRAGPHKYSVYPKPDPNELLRVTLPPRTSSLNTVPLSPPRRRALKSSKSSANIRPPKPSHSLEQLHPLPVLSKDPVKSSRSAPVSPAYPPPPPPRALRSATSAFNLREKSALSQAQKSIAVPLPPLATNLAPTSSTLMPESQQPSRPQLESFTSVFEIDSDRESYVESSSFTKRIARGFHKKSASEKRVNGERRGSADSQASEKDSGSESPTRKRGGSLGRILGLRSR